MAHSMGDGGTRQSNWLPLDRVFDSMSVPGTAVGVLVLLAGADIVLTMVGLQSCFSEQNPVARWVLHAYGPAGLVVLKSGALGLLLTLMWQLPKNYERAAFGGFGLTQLFAVGWNSVLLASHAPICGL